jgi:hypothetical protein
VKKKEIDEPSPELINVSVKYAHRRTNSMKQIIENILQWTEENNIGLHFIWKDIWDGLLILYLAKEFKFCIK